MPAWSAPEKVLLSVLRAGAGVARVVDMRTGHVGADRHGVHHGKLRPS
jgi:hypothetical protein